MIASRAPITCAAMATPCSTFARLRMMSVRASGLSGSASYAFATSSVSRSSCFAAATTARSLSARGYPAPPRPRRPLAATTAMSSSGAMPRAFPTPGSPRPSNRVAAVLAGIGRLEHVLDLVLVQLVVRRRWRHRRPHAGDAEVAGVLASAARHRGALARGRAPEVREQRCRRVHIGHRLAELRRDPLGRAPGEVAVFGVRPVEHARHAIASLGLGPHDAVDLAEVERTLVLRRDGHDRG